jgi:hypothetical protein
MTGLILFAFVCYLTCIHYSKQIKLAQVERTTTSSSGSALTTTSSGSDGNNISTSTIEVSTTPNGLSRRESIIYSSTGSNFRGHVMRTNTSLRNGNGRVRISSVSSSSTSIGGASSESSPPVLEVKPVSEENEHKNATDTNFVSMNRQPEEDMGNITFSIPDFNEKLIPRELGDFVVRSELMEWKLLPIKTQNFYVTQEGDLFVINKDNYLYNYDELRNKFKQINFENNNLTFSFVVVTSDKTPYVINKKGDIFYMYNQTWIQLPGCATMLAVGRQGEVYKLGCEKKEGGYEVYMLSCTQDENYIDTFPHMQNNSTCSWYRLNGRGMKLSILNNGLPVIINDTYNILYFTGNNWNPFLGIKGKEISFSNSGLAMVIGLDDTLMGINYFIDPVEIYVIGIAKKVGIGPYTIPTILGNDDNLYMGTKFILE